MPEGCAVSDPADVYRDLVAEGAAVDQILSGLDAEQWDLQTPAPGWTIKHQVAHLSSIVSIAKLTVTDPDTFRQLAAGAAKDFDGAVNALLTPYLSASPADLLARWRTERDAANEALSAVPPDQILPWVARDIPAGMLASAGLMELFAHGQDIWDTVGVRRDYDDKIRHLAGFGARNWNFGYLARGLTPPDVQFRFELTAPSGALWEFGPADATERVEGQALDFCMLVTRRRHRDDLALTATGAEAGRWMDIAQSYRGSPGAGRQPGQFKKTSA